jgi:hypothetical protein
MCRDPPPIELLAGGLRICLSRALAAPLIMAVGRPASLASADGSRAALPAAEVTTPAPH